MYNLARAAEAGWQGTVADALDYELVRNGQRPLLAGGHWLPILRTEQRSIR